MTILKRTALPEDTLVAVMLCVRLPDDGNLRPLTQNEFRQTADMLGRAEFGLADVLSLPQPSLASVLTKKTLLEKVSALRSRFRATAEAVERWADKGIWILRESDEAYPDKLRRRLAATRPPLLFGFGPNTSLDAGGICIVGSRNSSDEAVSFTQNLAARCASEQLTVISSNMRGVDRAAIQTATENSGRALMVLSDRLEKTILQPRFAKALSDQALTMVTPFAPDVGFSIGNAVRANRYQYALSDLAVIAETRSKGGIWQGAEENRKGDWVPAFVRSSDTIPSGNRALLHLGLTPITLAQVNEADNVTQLLLTLRNSPNGTRPAEPPRKSPADLALFRLFQTELVRIAKKPVSLADITAHFSITNDQAALWLARCVEMGTMQRVSTVNDTWVARKR